MDPKQYRINRAFVLEKIRKQKNLQPWHMPLGWGNMTSPHREGVTVEDLIRAVAILGGELKIAIVIDGVREEIL